MTILWGETAACTAHGTPVRDVQFTDERDQHGRPTRWTSIEYTCGCVRLPNIPSPRSTP